ncbi:MAG: tyrosine recombinase [Rickettsiales bacterium]|nr:tyrosine recombinase [Rickettsiales bacterium]|tara:strand:- start:64 stop:996 length:933 start_codon:yes stop_codon:yes gene_type:complete
MTKSSNKMDNLIELFLDKIITEKNLSKASTYAYETDLKHFSKFLSIKKKSFLSITEEDFLSWNKYLIEKKYKINSRIRKSSVISQFMNFLFLEKYSDRNFSKKISVPKHNKTLPKLISEQQILKLLNYLKKNNDDHRKLQTLVITELLYATGMRITELVTLKKSAVSDNLNNILVLGKGMKERVVPLGDEAKLVLKIYLDKIERDSFIKEKNKRGWLFPSRKSHLTRQAYFLNLKKAAIQVNIDPAKVSPHVLRHAFASHMLNHGADLKVIQYFLGHEDISTVQIYTHVNSKKSLEASKRHPLARVLPKK